MLQKFFRQKLYVKALILGGCVAVLVAGFFWSISSALTGTITTNSDITVAWPVCNTTCPATGSKYTLVDDGATENTADWLGTGTAGAGGEVLEFGLSTLANVQTVSQVQLCVNAQSFTNANGGTLDSLGFNLRIGGTLQTATTVTPAFNVWNNHCATFTGAWTQSQLDGMTAYMIRNRLGSGNQANQDDDMRVSNVYATITYEPVVTYEQSAFRWFNNQDITEPLTFVKTYGGTLQDKGFSMAQTSDGGYVVTGDTFSFGAGNTDLVLSKHDKSGELEWTKTWGGTGGDLGYSVAQASDGGYVVTGQTGSSGAGGFDAVVLKFTSAGALSWSKTWGGTGNDYGQSLVALADGSIVVTGWTNSYGVGVRDIILLKFDSAGALIWNKTWGTATEDYAEALVATADGGFAVAGHTNGAGAGDYDQLVVKFDSTGALSWNKTWGGVGYDDGYGITQLSDGGILVTGSTTNYGAGGDDVALIKYNNSGTLQWSRTWGGSLADQPSTLVAAADGGFAVAGQTTSFGAGANDFLALKYDSSGTLTWNKTWGGTGDDLGNLGRQTADGGFVFTGYTTNYGAGLSEAFIAKYDSGGTIDNCASPMCQTPTATVNSYTVVAGTPSVSLGTPSVTAATPVITAANAAYVTTFVAGKHTDVGSALSLQNTAATAPSGDPILRLRMNVHVGISNATAGLETFKLQYVAKGTGTCAAPSGGTPSAYADVTTNTHIAYANNAFTGDVTPLVANANDPVHGTDTIVRQTYEELNNIAIRNTITAGQDGQWDFALQVNSSAPDSTRYCFRLVKASGAVLNTYTQYPEIITPSKTISQSSYRFYQNADSVSPGAPLVAQNTATSVDSGSPLRLRQRLAVDGRQLNASAGIYKLQYAEKSGVCDPSFSGEIYSDISPKISGNEVKAAGTVSDITNAGNSTWSNPGNATTDNGSDATATVTGGTGYTHDLVSASHGLTVPSNATINGIELIVDRSSGGYIAVERNIKLVKGGVIQATDRARTSQTWDNAGGNWGGPSDLWGDSWTPADVNASNFGAAVAVYMDADGVTASANVDHMTIKVYYTTPGGAFSQNLLAGTGSADTSGTVTVSNPQDITAFDDISASFSRKSATPATTNYIQSSNHGFSIPTNATILGITATFERTANIPSFPGDGGVFDNSIRLIKAGSLVGTDASEGDSWEFTTSIGSSTSLWGTTWTASDINSSQFGVAIRANIFGDNTNITYGYLDAVSINISYSVPAGGGVIDYFDNPSTSDGSAISSSANDPINGARPTVYQTYRENDPYVNGAAVPAGSDGLWDFAFTTGSAAAGKTYCLRTVQSNGALLNTYSNIPELTVNALSGGLTLDQKLWGGAGVQGGVKSPFSF